MNWLLLIVLAIIIINALIGRKVGLIKIVFSLFSFIIALFLTTWISPSVNEMLINNESFYQKTNQKVEEVLFSKVEEDIAEAGDIEKLIASLPLPQTIKDSLQANKEKQETNIPGIYAVGDCTGQIMLAHVASAQGEVAAENALGHISKFDSKTNPSCVYTKPEFASVGLTEEAAKTQGIDYVVGKFSLVANGRAMIMGEDGMVKIIADKKYKEILGAHILGPRATDLIGEFALAISLEATVDEVIATIHAHPTISEAIKEAALSVEKRAIHLPKK